MPDIIIFERVAKKLEKIRETMKKKLGPKYSMLISPYAAILERDCKQRKLGCYQCARELVAFLRHKGKRNTAAEGMIWCAALDAMERNQAIRDIRMN